MEFLTAEEVAKILRTSVWFVYEHRNYLGGIKIGKVVRFDKQVFENKIKEVMENDSISASEQVEIRFLEEQSSISGKRISHKARSKSGGSGNPKKSKTDEFGLYRLMREPPERP